MLGYNKLEPYFSLMELNVSKRNKLQTLDLSGNAITKMHADIFAGLTNLRILYFEINSMWIFHLNIGHMMNLQYVHMRHSQISSFSLEVRQHIDVLCRNKSRVVEIDLSLNPIRCDCDNYDFIQWMVSSRAFDPTFADYICQYADSSFKNITDAYEETLRELQRKRTDNSLTLLFVIAATFIMVAFVIAGIIYRFRWKLRYIYYATYLKLKHSEQEHHGQFRYDVFISYAHQDEEFILKDVYPGYRKNCEVCILHAHLFMANMESVHTGRQVLVFLLKDSLNNKQLGTELLFHIRNNTYVVYPQNDTKGSRNELSVFWDKLY
ncbi:toll receptor 4 [Biomphalaria glabrata]|nr:toll receptor 4 [Biomphalaria glabrata]